MSETILIIGESGTGKSTSIRNLSPEETYIINVIDKSLPFATWSKKYNDDNKNYYSSVDANNIIKCMHAISDRLPNIKNIIIDDWQYILSYQYMRRAKETGYAKFTDIGLSGFSIIDNSKMLRKNLTVFILTHSTIDEKGFSKIKTIGKLLDEKIVIEGLVTCVLHARVIDNKYMFQTQRDDYYLAKSPMGMFNEMYIDNDLAKVKEIMNNYDG